MNAGETKYVLVVEDDPRSAALIKVMLKLIEMVQAIVCRSGSEIIPASESLLTIHLVLLDIQVPDEDGYQMLRRLRKEPKFAHVPIAAVTAQVMPDDIKRAEEAGFDGFLGKPLNYDRFPDQIRRLLRGERVWEAR